MKVKGLVKVVKGVKDVEAVVGEYSGVFAIGVVVGAGAHVVGADALGDRLLQQLQPLRVLGDSGLADAVIARLQLPVQRLRRLEQRHAELRRVPTSGGRHPAHSSRL